ncbi:MAG: DUF4349 domain-containing protein [Candidatus Limnocylindria bacterium]
MTRPASSIARPAPFILLLVLVLAACGAGGGDQAGMDPGSVADGAEVPAAGAGEMLDRDAEGGDDAGGPGGPVGGEPLAAPIEQRIIKTGEITLEVENVAETLGRVRALTAELNGYVGGSQAGTLEESATLTIRVPADGFDTMLARLHELDVEVIAEATREQDVTGQVVDLEARVDNLRASEASYRELIARAEEVEDILAVQSRLDQVRGEIEQLTAQLEALEGQADLSTLTVTLLPRAEPIETQAATWDPGAQLDRALASLVGIGQGMFDGFIWFAIVWLPVLGVLAVIVLLLLRGVLEVRRRMPPSGVLPPATTRDEGGA